MNIFFLLISLLIFAQAILAQKKYNKVPPPPPTSSKQESSVCGKIKNISFSNRLKNYPFGMATQIKMVSFDSAMYNIKEVLDLSNNKNQNADTILPKFNEVKSLTLLQIDALTNILYNYGFTCNTCGSDIAGCYEPRNAILFINAKNDVFAYIEICFRCENTEVSSPKILLGDNCDGKIDMIKKLFKTVGIKYGLKKADTISELQLPLQK